MNTRTLINCIDFLKMKWPVSTAYVKSYTVDGLLPRVSTLRFDPMQVKKISKTKVKAENTKVRTLLSIRVYSYEVVSA